MRTLVWYRSDLRTADHPALHHAVEAADEGVVAVFMACPDQWREHDWGDVKVDYLRRNLDSLQKRLDDLRVPLLIETVDTFADVPDRLLEVAREHDCDALFMNRELEVNERRRDDAVARVMKLGGIDVHLYHDQTVLEPSKIRTAEGDVYSVFTPFSRRWREVLEDEGGPRLVPRPKRLAERVCPPDPVPESFAGFDPVGHLADLWPAGEDVAEKQLEAFLGGRASKYKDERDVPSIGATSELSAALALGVVSARTCLAAALAANEGRLEGGDEGLAAWIRQIIWRDFYRHVLVGYPRVSKGRAFKEKTESIPWRDVESEAKDDWNAWCEGRTGYPIIDAGLRQLRETGYMHNRLRMLSAMFLTKHLLIDWRQGERHFMRHLVDGDLANNNGGWQWSASTGTDAAPYFRIFNPWTQGKRYDGDGEYIKEWVPELADVPSAALHDPEKLRRALDEAGVDYPEPRVEHASARQRALETFQEAA